MSLSQIAGFPPATVEDIDADEVAADDDPADADVPDDAAGGWLGVDVQAATATAVTAAVAASRADGSRREGFVIGVTTFAGPSGQARTAADAARR